MADESRSREGLFQIFKKKVLVLRCVDTKGHNYVQLLNITTQTISVRPVDERSGQQSLFLATRETCGGFQFPGPCSVTCHVLTAAHMWTTSGGPALVSSHL